MRRLLLRESPTPASMRCFASQGESDSFRNPPDRLCTCAGVPPQLTLRIPRPSCDWAGRSDCRAAHVESLPGRPRGRSAPNWPHGKTIHEQGLVSVLKQIHDDLDAAVFEAYGWPVTLTDEEILESLAILGSAREVGAVCTSPHENTKLRALLILAKCEARNGWTRFWKLASAGPEADG